MPFYHAKYHIDRMSLLLYILIFISLLGGAAADILDGSGSACGSSSWLSTKRSESRFFTRSGSGSRKVLSPNTSWSRFSCGSIFRLSTKTVGRRLFTQSGSGSGTATLLSPDIPCSRFGSTNTSESRFFTRLGGSSRSNLPCLEFIKESIFQGNSFLLP